MARHPEITDEWYVKAAEAAKLKRAGHTWAEVAAMTGYASRGSAHSAVKRVLQEHQSLAFQEVALLRQESLDRYQDLLKAVWPAAMLGDDKAVTQARLLIQRIDVLTNTEAPVALQMGGSDVDRLLRDALDEFNRRASGFDREAGTVPAD